MSTLLDYRLLVVALAVFCLAHDVVLRQLVRIYPKNHPRRNELVAELHVMPWLERPLFVAQQLQTALAEGLPARRQRHQDRRLVDRRAQPILLSDEPHKVQGDPLGFSRVAATLAARLFHSGQATPITLGIEGGWGCGKSSLMHQLDKAVRLHPGVKTAWFNAWSASGSSALEGLTRTALRQLDPSVLRKVLRHRRLVGATRLVALAVTSRLGIRGLVDATWDRLSADPRARNELRDLVHEAVKQWHTKGDGAAGDRVLVMFVDDLDRASPAGVFETLEAIKLFLDTPGFMFVIGYDDAVLSEAVPKEPTCSQSVSGYENLAQIVQVGYRITQPDDDQATSLVDLFTRDSGTVGLFNDTTLRMVIERNQRNPRRIKRFLNSYVLLYAFDPDWQAIGPVRLLEVLLLDNHFAEFMALFREGNDGDPVTDFLEYREQRQKVLDDETTTRHEQLRDLQRNLPEQYPGLVENTEFVSLLKSLHGSPQWVDVSYKLQRRGAAPGAGVVNLHEMQQREDSEPADRV